MNQPLAKQAVPTDELAKLTPEIVSEMTNYSLAQMRLITKTVAQDCPLIELATFLHACNKLHLDPLLKQAYWIRRKGREKDERGNWVDVYRGTLQIGIDGFRALADRQGNYLSSEAPEFRDWFEMTDKDTGEVKLAPGLARVITRKVVGAHVGTFTGEARWNEFYPGEGAVGKMWRKFPTLMLAKCAEAQSLRKGWPAILGAADLMVDEAQGEGPFVETIRSHTIVEPLPGPSTRDSEAYARAFPEDAFDLKTVKAPPVPTRRAQPDPQPEPELDDVPTDEDDAPAPPPNTAQALERYTQYLRACKRALGDRLNAADWYLPSTASVEEIEAKGLALTKVLEAAGEADNYERREAEVF